MTHNYVTGCATGSHGSVQRINKRLF